MPFFDRLHELYVDNVDELRTLDEIKPLQAIGITAEDVQKSLRCLQQLGIVGGAQSQNGRFIKAKASPLILEFKSVEERLKQYEIDYRDQQKLIVPIARRIKTAREHDNWVEIQSVYGIGKTAFGKKLRFIKDRFKRSVIFRDVEHAHICLKSGLFKSAVILAGGVIEEILRLYLEQKEVKAQGGKFVDYISACKEEGLIKSAVLNLSSAIKDFRNHVHLEKESSRRHSISKATAAGAVNAIFTVVNDIQ